MMLRMVALSVFVLSLSSALVCPDGGVCEDRNTCCKDTAGGYGCCPLPHAECCSDHLHCCYQGTLCDLVHQRCVNKTTSLPWMSPLPANQRSSFPQLSLAVKAVICPDHESECPDETTCCLLSDHSWGCCPLVKAVCCEDRRHCCPEGTQCDLEHSKCVSASLGSIPMLEKTVAAKRTKRPATLVHSVVCPGGKSQCPDTYTCCQLSSGDFGCCPFPQATCCSDHLHCCPSNAVCDLKHGTCRSGTLRLPLGKKIPSVPVNRSSLSRLSQLPATVSVPSVGNKCDESTSCPGVTTCCKTESGDWACCPLPQAVCCDDHIHCCPHGSVCNLAAQTCDDPSTSSPSVTWTKKTRAMTIDTHGEKCDAQTMCPRGNTCCQKEDGQWACCPLPQAVCCDDHEHCCPKGYRCNVAEQTCDKPDATAVLWLQKALLLQGVPVTLVSGGNMCDSKTSCPGDTTCCFMKREQKWGCCLVPEAVCCEDGDHCCPKGHSCEPHRSSCSRGPHVVPWFTKLSARTQPASISDVKCDDKSSCASGTTCCRLPTKEWGCCPLVKAVCCEDHEHCCPQSYTCNMQTGTCEKNFANTFPQSKVVRSDLRGTDHGSDVPCDSTGEYHCPLQHTCCQVSDSEWGCCPFTQAVCCSASLCCPSGSSCDVQAGICTRTLLTWDHVLKSRKTDSRL
ncbi:granulin b [Gouania willdenowi]|uniref:granulin b n=1 Tax=Gouania willdenowi TaxID=441366 RepID=UPI001055910D|nr:progranulin-like [Gouania willdenowi]